MVKPDLPIRPKPTNKTRIKKGYTVSRYKLRLVKEAEEKIAEPETLVPPGEIAEFLWTRSLRGRNRGHTLKWPHAHDLSSLRSGTVAAPAALPSGLAPRGPLGVLPVGHG